MTPTPPGDGEPKPAHRLPFEQASDFQALAMLQDETEDAAFVIAGRYQVLSTLGQGGMGAVYKARDTRLGRTVAIKTILPQLLSRPDASRRFFREAEALARLDHPNILTLYDSGNDGAQHFLVMQLGGRDLVYVLERQGGPLPLAPALHIALAVARALDYAHQRGIVHRDLKPANILIGSPDDPAGAPLTPFTAVKVMDFGLAKIEGASLLTVPQARLGTPQYMSPEQALGREADARADLYALGVLLYELATGVRPFDGDDTASILSQHLNLAPVPPSVFNEALPATLEALILRLLEKDPAQRPAAASIVAQVLEEIAAAAQAAALPAPSPAGGPRPTSRSALSQSSGGALYRRVFAGRAAEQRQLRAAFDAAAAGQGALALVVGEPGIGKTALCEQLAAYVTQRGGRVLWGHSYEEGSVALPYLPFVEALRSYVADRPVEALRAEAGGAAPDLARLISAIGERLQVDPRPAGDPEEARWRLLEAVAGFLRAAATAQPILLILEDLHWADRGALDLLTHLARNLGGARLLVAGTYRNVEVDRAHPLSKALADLRRATDFARLQLAGLPAAEVGQVLEAIAGHGVPEGFVEAVQRQTEGNPLFVQEIVRYLAESGLMTQQEGRWQRTGAAPLALEIPEGLRDVIGRRLSALSAKCNRVLSAAAVIGRDFDLDTLLAVAGVSEEALEEALDEAIRVAVVEEQGGRGVAQYRFAHALVRQTLYEEIRGPRRLRLHGQVARALEARHQARLEEHAAELAEHFAQSTDPASLAKAVQYGEMAARRALSVYAYAEAVRLLEQTLEVQEVLDPDDKLRRCDLLLALGTALMPAGEPRRTVNEIAPETLGLAEAMGDQDRASQSCQLALEGLRLYAGTNAWSTPLYRQWAERADRHAAPETVARVYADLTLAAIRNDLGQRLRDSAPFYFRALELARRLDNPEAIHLSTSELIFGLRTVQHEPDRQRLVEELTGLPRDGVSIRTLGGLLWRSIVVYLDWGKRADAEKLHRELAALANQKRESSPLMTLLLIEGFLAVIDGQLETAAAGAERIVALGNEHGRPVVGRIFATLITLRAFLHLGQDEQTLALVAAPSPLGDQWARTEVSPMRTALCLAHLGRLVEARAAFNQALKQDRIGSEDDETTKSDLVMLLEAAVLLHDRQAAALLTHRLERAAALAAIDNAALTTVARHLGAAAALLGDQEQARRYYNQALEVCAKIRFRPETALTRLHLAELDAEEGRTTAAQEHLAFCIPEFEAMKMAPALERARALRERLG